MNYYDSYIRSVRDRAWFASDIDAVKAIRSVLEAVAGALQSVRPMTWQQRFPSISGLLSANPGLHSRPDSTNF